MVIQPDFPQYRYDSKRKFRVQKICVRPSRLPGPAAVAVVQKKGGGLCQTAAQQQVHRGPAVVLVQKAQVCQLQQLAAQGVVVRQGQFRRRCSR